MESVLTTKHLREMERVLSTPTERLPWVVHPSVLEDMERLGICTDGFIASAPFLPYNTDNNTTHTNKNNNDEI